jgi:hypothetical protein
VTTDTNATNGGIIRGGFFYAVRAEVIYRRPVGEIEELQVSRQPARSGAVEHGSSKRNPSCRKPLLSNGYLNTLRNEKTSML